MNIVKIILEKSKEAGKDVILIGGHAVNALGVERATHDIDFAIKESEEYWWKNLLTPFGYSLFSNQPAFFQLRGALSTSWAVDFMKLDDSTFAKLKAKGRIVDLDGMDCMVPDPGHLISMKFHALKSEYRRKDNNDLSDIVGISLKHRISLEELKQIAGQFGDKETYDEVERRIIEQKDR
jgi:hypothetical protein